MILIPQSLRSVILVRMIYLIEDIDLSNKKKNKQLQLSGSKQILLDDFIKHRKNKKKLKELILSTKDDDDSLIEVSLNRKEFNSKDWRKIKANRVVSNFKPKAFKDEEILPISTKPELFLLNCSRNVDYSQFFSLQEWLEDEDSSEYAPRVLEERGGNQEHSIRLFSFNVGQGNSALLYESLTRTLKFIDFGGSPGNSNEVMSFFRFSKRIDDLTEIFITHFDEDHVRFVNLIGPDNIRGQVLVGPVQLRISTRIIRWITNWINDGLVLQLIPNVNYGVNVSHALELRRVRISNLNLSSNETGIAYSIERNGFRCLLPGDASYRNVFVAYPRNEYNYLAVSHHGSSYSLPTLYQGQVPSLGPISHGGRYGHPHRASIVDHTTNGWNTFELTNYRFHYLFIVSDTNYIHRLV